MYYQINLIILFLRVITDNLHIAMLNEESL